MKKRSIKKEKLKEEAKEVILKELEEKGVINYMRAKLKNK